MVKKCIRVDKKNSAFVYAILESLEGMASFSTLDHEPGKNYRDLEICVADGFLKDIDAILAGMAKEFPILDITSEGSQT